MRKTLYLMLCIAVLLGCAASAFAGKSGGKSGTTLAATKTIEICEQPGGNWQYSGKVAVWNEGAVDTQGFQLQDCIQNKVGTSFVDVSTLCTLFSGNVIPAATTEGTATVFSYVFSGAPLTGDIRNVARLTITNHSGSLGTPFGPEPKATYVGGVPPEPCFRPCGCVYTQGYWGNKPDVIWPSPYDRNATFFLSGATWQQVMDTSVAGGNAYYQLAHQYVAAVLNQANGACVPAGIQIILDAATTWLGANSSTSCSTASSCGIQKDWASILDTYNNGLYENGPAHCE